MHFFSSLRQIVNSESVNPLQGLCRHLGWQARRTLGRFPCELTISHSRLLAEEASGVPALVNAMGIYDYHNMSLLQYVIERRPATFVDIGANIGSYTIIASEYETANVVSIEPHPATFEKLMRNVKINGRKNVACFNFALSDQEGKLNLSDLSDSTINRVVRNVLPDEKCISVPCRTLDGLCAELKISPDIVKIDVEGHEVQIIQGFRESLRRASLLFIEGGEKREICSIMNENGLHGPLYFHQRKGALMPWPQRRAEDPLYVSTALLEGLRPFGVTLSGKISGV